MFDKLFDKFDDFDMEKVMEVVNLVWNNREKFIDLIENLPKLLRETGESIESAGASAMKASSFLAGGDNDAPSAGDISEIAATALERCYRELRSAAKVMDSVGKELDAVRIPSVKPKYMEVMGHKLIGGLDIGEDGLFDNVADRLTDGSDRLDAIGKDLRLVAGNLRDLGGVLTDTGKDLNDVGVQLKQSGGTLRSLSNLK
ncbi:MAG: hypothetical protein GY943_19705 [Chloroflexi bacterium]|nr:hypothetical protein [Chloroflexota bacterium]